MLRPDLWWWNAARVEIDHRAREARLRLEHLERLLILRVLPASRPRRVFDRRGLRFFRGGVRTKPIDENGSARSTVRSSAPYTD